MFFFRKIKQIMDTSKYLYLLHYLLISLVLFDIALRFNLTKNNGYMTLSGALLLPLARVTFENFNKKKLSK